MDIKSTFSNDNVEYEVYMEQLQCKPREINAGVNYILNKWKKIKLEEFTNKFKQNEIKKMDLMSG